MKKVLTAFLAAGLVLGTTSPAHAADVKDVTISGSGSTAIKNLLDVCIPAYQQETGATVNYAGGGSGAGRTALAKGTVDFAFSDAPYGASDSKPNSFIYVPAAQFPLAIFAKIDGYTGKLNLSPKSVSGIFAGTITKWNDASILADNTTNVTSVDKKTKKKVTTKSVAKLPATDITVWYRSDKSGSTGILTNWLTSLVPETWKKAGEQTFTAAFPGTIPAGVFQGGSGSDGVANGVASKNGSIGYAETSYATERKLTVINIQNNVGEFIAPTAAATAIFNNSFKPGDNGTIAIDPTEKVKGGYTLAGYTYGLAYGDKADKHPKLQGAVADFFEYVVGTCAQKNAESKGYAPLTGSLAALARTGIAKIK
jgi:phosphate transport system substrate-binding protein